MAGRHASLVGESGVGLSLILDLLYHARHVLQFIQYFSVHLRAEFGVADILESTLHVADEVGHL